MKIKKILIRNLISNKTIYKELLFAILLFLLFINVLDGISTQIHVERYGIEVEQNGFTKWVYYNFGEIGFIVKLYVLDSITIFMRIMLGFGILYYLRSKRWYWIYILGLFFFMWKFTDVVINNFSLLV